MTKRPGAIAFRTAKTAMTFGEWRAKPDTPATRGDIMEVMAIYDQELAKRLYPLWLAEHKQRVWWRRLIRRIVFAYDNLADRLLHRILPKEESHG